MKSITLQTHIDLPEKSRKSLENYCKIEDIKLKQYVRKALLDKMKKDKIV